MPTTANRGYRFPASTDNTQIWQHIQNTASDIDADMAAQLAAWTSYVPVWTSTGTAPSLGNGTITGRYKQVGKLVVATIKVVFGSTSTFGTGAYSFSLPVAASGSTDYVGSAYMRDASGTSTGHYAGIAVVTAVSPTVLTAVEASGHTQLQATLPVVWANTDFLEFTITYEAA
jgi:hypothetical protein